MLYADPQIYLNIKFNDVVEALPVNPEKLAITRNASNTDIDVIGLGHTVRKGHPGLISMKINSFFPHKNSNFNYFGKTPEHYIKFINDIWESDNINNRVATLTTIGITPGIDDMPFVIDSFEYEHRGGDFDIYYTLSIKEYVPYGAKEQVVSNTGMKASRVTSAEVPNDKVYIVVAGDTLSSITKKCTGGTGDWRALYELNKDIIGADPNTIYPGQKLILPDNWNAPVVTTQKSKPISTKATKENNKTNTNSSAETEPVTGINKLVSPEELAKQKAANENLAKTKSQTQNKLPTSDKGAIMQQYNQNYDIIKQAQEALAKDNANKEAAKKLAIAEKENKAAELYLSAKTNQAAKVPAKPNTGIPTPKTTPPTT